MKTSLPIASMAMAVALGACGGSAMTGATSNYTPAHITSGGSGLNLTPGACIASGTISSKALRGVPNPVSVTVLSEGDRAVNYTLEDTLGNSITANAGSTVIIDGATLTLVNPSPKSRAKQSFTIQPATD